MQHIIANNQNVQCSPIQSISFPKENVTINTSVQLAHTAILLAAPFTLDANNSPIIIHGNGPKPRENITMNTATHIKGSQPMFGTSSPLFLRAKYRPKIARHKPMILADKSNKILRPARSTMVLAA